MPRILIKGSWYDPVAGSSLYEADYENAIIAHSAGLFPGFFCCKFKALIDSEYGRARPDLALVDEEYRSWYVVEVELDEHPLESHVEEQVRKFAYGVYTKEHAAS